jgi:hypothetical protein
VTREPGADPVEAERGRAVAAGGTRRMTVLLVAVGVAALAVSVAIFGAASGRRGPQAEDLPVVVVAEAGAASESSGTWATSSGNAVVVVPAGQKHALPRGQTDVSSASGATTATTRVSPAGTMGTPSRTIKTPTIAHAERLVVVPPIRTTGPAGGESE